MHTARRAGLAQARELVAAHAKMIVRDRQSIVFAFVTPVLLMLLVGLAFGRGLPIFLNVGVADEDQSVLSRAVVDAIAEGNGTIVYEGTRQDQLAALEQGHFKLVIVLPAGFEYGRLGYETTASVYTNPADPDAPLALTAVRNAFAQLEARAGRRAFAVEEHAVGGRVSRYLDFLVPGILGLAILNLGLMGALSPLAAHRRSGVLRRVGITPMPVGRFVAAQGVVSLLLAVAQAMLILGIAVAGFGVELRGSLPVLLMLVLLGNAVFVLLGVALAAVVRSFPATVMVAILVILPMLFLSGVLFSINAMPGFMLPLVYALPLTHLNTGLRDVMQWGGGFAAARGELAVLGAWAAILVPAAVRGARPE